MDLQNWDNLSLFSCFLKLFITKLFAEWFVEVVEIVVEVFVAVVDVVVVVADVE